jgi:hypothetical protein
MTTASAVSAQSGPVVVELFTSQGCSSCPPADALLHELAARDDVIALALHVDYWDYIGWKDQFAHPRHTERQKSYAVRRGERTIYTPQMIVGGTDSVVGARAMELVDFISAHAALPRRVGLSIARTGDTLSIRAQAMALAPEQDMIIQLVRFTPERSIDITRGENAGHTMHYANVVSDWVILAEWDGQAPFASDIALTGDDSVAVLVQYVDQGQIVAAAQLD